MTIIASLIAFVALAMATPRGMPNGTEICPILDNGKCPEGYTLNGDGETCSDIDECLENNGGCMEICNNVCGSSYCSCPEGYKLASDGKSCELSTCFAGTEVKLRIDLGDEISYKLDRNLTENTTMTLACDKLNPDYGCEATLTCDSGELVPDTKGCCAHCRTSEWTNGTCSATCGVGAMTQVRDIIQEPDENGKDCGNLFRQVECNLRCCPVDCVMGDWVESACSTTCGCGLIERTREVLQKPSCGGLQCANRQEFLACENKPCDEEKDNVPYPAPRLEDDTPKYTVLVNDTEEIQVISEVPSVEVPGQPVVSTGEAGETGETGKTFVPMSPTGEPCQYGPWENYGECSVNCGVGKQTQVRQPIEKHEGGCSQQFQDISCESHCGVDTRIWKHTHCSGIELEFKHVADFHEPTEIENCREQPGEEDANAIAVCVEKCNSLKECAGFTFERGHDNSNRCCFFSDTSYKQYNDPHQVCFEKVDAEDAAA